MIVAWTWVVQKQLNSRNKYFADRLDMRQEKKGGARSLISSEEGCSEPKHSEEWN